MSQKNDPLIYHEEGEIAFIEINCPEKKNALNYECWQLFDKYCDELNAAKKIRALVITGCPADIFSAGVDVTPTDPFIAEMFQALQNRDKANSSKALGICKVWFQSWPIFRFQPLPLLTDFVTVASSSLQPLVL